MHNTLCLYLRNSPNFRKLLTIVFLFASATLFAQQRIGDFTAYSKESGLGQNVYHNVIETSDGYWWISSDNGVFRFDGKRFTHFNAFFDNPNSLSDNNVTDLTEDNNGNLWMAGLEHGLTRYNLKTGRFRKYPVLSKDNNPTAYGVLCVYKDSNGYIWAGTKGRGLAKYDAVKDTFRFFYPDSTKSKDGSRYGENVVAGIIEDNTNNNWLWLSCFDGLYLFDKTSEKFIAKFWYTEKGRLDIDFSFLCITQAGENLYLGSWFQGLFVFNKKNKQFTLVPYYNPGKHPYKYCVLDAQAVNDSVVYLAAINDGMLAYSIKEKKIYAAINPKDAAQINNQVNIQRISLTTHSGLFAGGNSAIYQRFPQPGFINGFINYSYTSLFPNDNTRQVSTLLHDEKRNGYWVAFDNNQGIYFYDSSFSSRRFYPYPALGPTWFTSLALDGNSRLWACGTDGRLYSIDEKKAKIIPLNISPVTDKIYGGNSIHSLASDHSGNIWMIGSLKCYHVNTGSEQSEVYDLSEMLRTYPAGNFAAKTQIRVDQNDNAWVGTNNGLIMLDIRTHKVNYFSGQVNANCILAPTPVKSIAIDKNNKLWIGYFSEGIQVLDLNTMTITQSFTTRNGLQTMEINYLAADSSGNIAACLTSGLGIYSDKTGEWQFFNLRDGLRIDYLDLPVWTNDKGEFILDQKGSLLTLNYPRFWTSQQLVPVHIASFTVNGKPYSSEVQPDYITSVELGPGTKEIQLAFSAFNWQSPLRTNYFYRVEGIHKTAEWLQTDNAVVSFTGLASGHYVFQFYALLADGSKTAERQLKIYIRPPFYKTLWFIAVVGFAIVLILYSLYRYRINQLKKIQHMRNNISRNLHDDIGSTLTNISFLNELAKRNLDVPNKAKEYLVKSEGDIKKVSENLGDIVWNINPQYEDFAQLFIRMKHYAAEMMEGCGIDCLINFPEDMQSVKLTMEKRRNLYLIFKEAVNNIAKYSQARHVKIEFSKARKYLHLHIEDDGKGFDEAAVKQGNGLNNMKQRAGLCNATIQINSQLNKGTMVHLQMPI